MEGLGLMRVLLTGSEGYIGTDPRRPTCCAAATTSPASTPASTGSAGSYNGVDRAPAWRDDGHPARLTVEDLAGFDAVVHLAELSNDPVGELNPDITFEINHHGSVRLATLAQEAGVERFIYMSSCSVYGAARRRRQHRDVRRSSR